MAVADAIIGRASVVHRVGWVLLPWGEAEHGSHGGVTVCVIGALVAALLAAAADALPLALGQAYLEK